ncbi:hypothetical protein ABVT39_014583 [Epinephelus coioides]
MTKTIDHLSIVYVEKLIVSGRKYLLKCTATPPSVVKVRRPDSQRRLLLTETVNPTLRHICHRQSERDDFSRENNQLAAEVTNKQTVLLLTLTQRRANQLALLPTDTSSPPSLCRLLAVLTVFTSVLLCVRQPNIPKSSDKLTSELKNKSEHRETFNSEQIFRSPF